jgi:hypothetical protein
MLFQVYMTKAQTENQDCERGSEPIFRAGLGLPISNIVTERVKKLQDAIEQQQGKRERLLKENNTYLSSNSLRVLFQL